MQRFWLFDRSHFHDCTLSMAHVRRLTGADASSVMMIADPDKEGQVGCPAWLPFEPHVDTLEDLRTTIQKILQTPSNMLEILQCLWPSRDSIRQGSRIV